MALQTIQPEHFARPRGYANGVVATGKVLHVGGQIGWRADQTFATDDFMGQFAQTLDNVLDVVRAAGGKPTDIANMTVYATDLDAYRSGVKKLGGIWKERFGRHYPAMALVGVAGLVEPRALVEISAVAYLTSADAD